METERDKKQTRSMPSVGTQFRAIAEGEDRFIEGYFAVFGGIYMLWPGATESVDAHAFDNTLANEDIKALTNHDTTLVLGRTTANTLELKADIKGLWGRIRINPEDQDAMNLYARVSRGDVDQCSFGFDVLDEETTYNQDGTVHWTIKAVKLYEVSVVTFPAYEDTSVTARKRDFEQIKSRRAQTWKETMKARLKNGTQTTDH